MRNTRQLQLVAQWKWPRLLRQVSHPTSIEPGRDSRSRSISANASPFALTNPSNVAHAQISVFHSEDDSICFNVNKSDFFVDFLYPVISQKPDLVSRLYLWLDMKTVDCFFGLFSPSVELAVAFADMHSIRSTPDSAYLYHVQCMPNRAYR